MKCQNIPLEKLHMTLDHNQNMYSKVVLKKEINGITVNQITIAKKH
jgi:hypothetical protein